MSEESNINEEQAAQTTDADSNVDYKATSSMKIDRTKYGIEYGSGSVFKSLGDKMIYDEFELIIDLNY